MSLNLNLMHKIRWVPVLVNGNDEINIYICLYRKHLSLKNLFCVLNGPKTNIIWEYIELNCKDLTDILAKHKSQR